MPPKEFLGKPFFRDCWVERKFPTYAFAAAIVFQALLIRFPPPIWNLQPARALSTLPQVELTWYGPIKDFPLTLPAVREPKPAPRNNAIKPTPQHGVDAFHPRQTILSEPLHPNHPRQTLIQPRAPQEPPKILPALPNIVQLAAAQPERPKAKLTADQLAALRPKTPASLAATNAAAPEITTLEKQPGVINIASPSQAQPKLPLLPVNPMSAPRGARQRGDTNPAAPDVGGRSAESETLIALSATPTPVAPPPAMPAGNLSARVSISPEGPKPGAPGAAPPGGEGRGPEGIFIRGGNGANTSPTSSLSMGAASRAAGNPLPSRPVPRPPIAPEGSGSLSSDAAAAAGASPKLGVAPQDVLGVKHVYTLHVNMPNLTSATGSWVLNFAELAETDPGPSIRPDAPDLTGPAPLKKVDPKYPPELRAAHVDGEVVLYAIIRKDGSVDSIQLVKSIDPRLDANAMEALAQWKFRPAEKHGEPIDLEAVVHIPFRSRAPSF